LAENANVQTQGPEDAAELLQSLPDPVIGCDADGTVVYWSPAAEEAYGYLAAEARGRRAGALLHTRFPAPLLEITEELADLGRWQGHLEHRCKDGRTVRVDSRWAARRDPQGRWVGSVAVERELGGEAAPVTADAPPDEDAAAPARRVVHDINNALAVIVNYTAFVTAELESTPRAPGDAGPDAMRADLREIRTAAERAVQLTRELLG
jgi:two-component system cell cycle sensor histidine kinase/response regulator CckA